MRESLTRTPPAKPDVAKRVATRAMEAALASPAQPLDGATRTVMESRFGWNFGSVRIHAGGQAAIAAARLGANALTVGRDVVFGAGWSPSTEAGRTLLVHELTHVIQQRHGVRRLADAGQPGDSHELQADAVAQRVVSGQRAGASLHSATGSGGTPGIQLQAKSTSDLPSTHDKYSFWWWIDQGNYRAAFNNLDREVQRAGIPVARYISSYFEDTAKNIERAATGIDPDTKEQLYFADRLLEAGLGIADLLSIGAKKAVTKGGRVVIKVLDNKDLRNKILKAVFNRHKGDLLEMFFGSRGAYDTQYEKQIAPADATSVAPALMGKFPSQVTNPETSMVHMPDKEFGQRPLQPALLGVGAAGESVRTLQVKLQQLGYRLPRFGVDGIFGEETKTAVLAFQRDHGLAHDGVAGPKTLEAMAALSWNPTLNLGTKPLSSTPVSTYATATPVDPEAAPR